MLKDEINDVLLHVLADILPDMLKDILQEILPDILKHILEEILPHMLKDTVKDIVKDTVHESLSPLNFIPKTRSAKKLFWKYFRKREDEDSGTFEDDYVLQRAKKIERSSVEDWRSESARSMEDGGSPRTLAMRKRYVLLLSLAPFAVGFAAWYCRTSLNLDNTSTSFFKMF